MPNPSPSLHQNHLNIESTCTVLETLIFLLDQYGQTPTDRVDVEGISRLLELVSFRMKNIFNDMSYHASQEEIAYLHKHPEMP